MNAQRMHKISGFGGASLQAAGLLFGKSNIRTASGLSLDELRNSGLDMAQLKAESKNVRQCADFERVLDREFTKVAHSGAVEVDA